MEWKRLLFPWKSAEAPEPSATATETEAPPRPSRVVSLPSSISDISTCQGCGRQVTTYRTFGDGRRLCIPCSEV